MIRDHEILIIGSGFGGIGAAIELQKMGIHDFVLLEKADRPGGTWYLNTYPGAAVDVQSYLYCYSFEPYDWSRVYAEQQEILDYTNHVLDKYKVREKVLCDHAVKTAHFSEEDNRWTVETKNGAQFRAPIIINATGVLNTPLFAEFEGIENYKGKVMHSSEWDHSYDHKGKRVGVIGTGASAVQIVPAIAADVEQLHVFQRTPHWTIHRPDRPFRNFERSLLCIPFIGKLYRAWLFALNEARVVGFTVYPKFMRIVRFKALQRMKRIIKDKALLKQITPDFMIGCKRILVTNDYLPALLRENVSLNSTGIEAFTEKGIRTKEEGKVELDLVVFCTGFKAADFFPYELFGLNGLSIHDSWKEGAHAYLGTTIPSFPNFFMIGGPNTGIGHTSAIHMGESQINYIKDAIAKFRQHNWKRFSVKTETEQAFNDELDRKMQGTIWQTGDCKSWYQNKNGKNTTLYPASNMDFRRRTRRFREEVYDIL